MNELHIDKTHWKKYRVDEVCRQVNEASKDPQAEGLDHVIGLEHIEPNNLHITQWDTLEKETTFTRKFRKGQVLFGRRRAYQRKVAYAEFDGICSGDILVFEAIEEVLLPELLPFLIQSEGFFQKALATSAGSLSAHQVQGFGRLRISPPAQGRAEAPCRAALGRRRGGGEGKEGMGEDGGIQEHAYHINNLKRT